MSNRFRRKNGVDLPLYVFFVNNSTKIGDGAQNAALLCARGDFLVVNEI